MKYKIDPDWNIGTRISTALDSPNEHMRYQLVCTSVGRAIVFLMADTPRHAIAVYEAMDAWEHDLQNSRGLCTMLYQKPKRGVCRTDAHYDGVVGVFNTDEGFRRSRQSIARTCAHEAMHAARVLAAKDLRLSISGADVSLTKEYEEAIAEWTGYLSQEFLNALQLLSL